MAKIGRIIGGAGTGKTTALLELMELTLENGVRDPRQIGFVSFTRRARQVAVERASDKFNVRPTDLQRDGWFRTLHSVCYRCLGVSKELLTWNKADLAWLEEVLQEPVEPDDNRGLDDVDLTFIPDKTGASVALEIWDAARQRMEPYKTAWSRAFGADRWPPKLEDCEKIVERYEEGKLYHNRLDFTDMLARFAGWTFTVEGPESVAPEGDVPRLPVWFLDEQQDTSSLLDSVCKRLIEPAEWVYVVGDPFQAIFGFAGSDGSLFRQWPAAKEKILRKSYRCPAPIHELGELALLHCSDYWNRHIKPADHRGRVQIEYLNRDLITSIDPRDEWLLLSRSNYHASRMARLLNNAGIPWLPMRCNQRSKRNDPIRSIGLVTLYNLGRGTPVDGEQWRAAIRLIPSRFGNGRLLQSGTKTEWTDADFNAADRYPCLQVSDLEAVGATPLLIEQIKSGQWREWVENSDDFCNAVARWGEEAVLNPRVRVGTIHSAKGAEALNVLLLSTSTKKCQRATESDEEAANEERRTAYVGITRAKQRLIVAQERTRYRMDIPA